MAKVAERTTSAARGGRRLKDVLIWCIVGLIAVAGGLAVPLFFWPNKDKPNPQDDEKLTRETTLVDFGEVITNLKEEKSTRFVKIKIMMEIAGPEQATNQLVEKNKIRLKSWLIDHLADQTVKDLEGKAGHERLRREIIEKFNEILYEDGSERVRHVYFADFMIQ